MNMKSVWAVSGGFFFVFIVITMTNRPHVKPRHVGASGPGNLAPARGGPSALPALAQGFQRGVVMSAPQGLDGPDADQALAQMPGNGVGWVALNLPFSQADGAAALVAADPDKTPTTAAVAHAIDAAHHAKLRVMLRPVVNAKDGTPRADFQPADPEAWVKSYGEAIGPMLDLARTHQVELFCLGSSYSRTETAAAWPALIRRARSLYSGSLVYGAAHAAGAGGGGYQSVPFWSLLDFVGIDAFFPLSQQATPGDRELMQGWEAVGSEVEAWAKRGASGKPVIFTTVGLPALAGAAARPDRPLTTAEPAPELQVASCKALFAVAGGEQHWLSGAFWYAWEAHAPNTAAVNLYGIQDGPTLSALSMAYRAGSDSETR